MLFRNIQPKREIVMKSSIHRSALNQLFNEARTYNEWSERPVDEQTVRDLDDLLKWGPTSANCCPARFVWVRSAEGKAKLAALAMDVNRPKILAAPVTVIIGYDLTFPENAEVVSGTGRGDAPDVPSTGAR
jgi:3-hydroxypropanoate dehydrogenase